MTIVISPIIREHLIRHAQQAAPKSAVGVLIMDGMVAAQYRPGTNLSHTPGIVDRLVDDAEIHGLVDEGAELAAYQSTNWNVPYPSREAHTFLEAQPIVVYSVAADSFGAYQPHRRGYTVLDVELPKTLTGQDSAAPEPWPRPELQ